MSNGAPGGDPKAERFRRVAAARANRVLEAISLLEQTADSTRYAYTDVQVQEIVTQLQTALGALHSAYQHGGARRSRQVTL